MTVSYIMSNTIGAGPQFIFGAPGDALVVMSGVTLGSTNSTAFTTAFSDVKVTVLGSMVSGAQLSMSTGSSFTLGAAGTFTSFQASIALAGLLLNGANSVAQIDGTFVAQEAIGLFTVGGGNFVSVTGSISAASAILLGGATGGDELINSGQITSNSHDDASNGASFNNAILVESGAAVITNLASGVITATSSEGIGVRLSNTAGGALITNYGIIQSLHSTAVQGGVTFLATAKLINSGVIQGAVYSFRGDSSGTYSILNSGRMIGDVLFGAGDDVFDGRGGRIDGAWTGGDGNDVYDGRGASLISGVVAGGNGLDTLLGGDGSETITGDSASDLLRGFGGDDSLSGGSESDTVYGGDGDDSMSGGLEYDEMFGGAGNDTIFGNLDGLSVDAGAGDDFVTVDGLSSSGIDFGLGGSGNDYFVGGLIGDLVYGGSGDDTIIGYEGNDLIYGDSGDDLLTNGIGDSRLYGGRGWDSLSGGDGNDLLEGGADDDTLNGGLGLDTMQGGSGDDLILSGDNNDSIEGGSGADEAFGGSGSDRLNGGTGSDALLGEAGTDTLSGGAGDDTLTGGASRDVLTGGSGADVFVLTAASESGTTPSSFDTINDFQTGLDRIDLFAVDANTLTSGNQAFTYLGSGAFTNVSGQLRYASGLLQGDTNGDGAADFVIELQNLTTLTAADLLL